MNNKILGELEKWCNDLSIKTVARPTCLLISRVDLDGMVGGNMTEITKTLKEVNTKLYITSATNDWYYVDCF
jgi:hypothetical protein